MDMVRGRRRIVVGRLIEVHSGTFFEHHQNRTHSNAVGVDEEERYLNSVPTPTSSPRSTKGLAPPAGLKPGGRPLVGLGEVRPGGQVVAGVDDHGVAFAQFATRSASSRQQMTTTDGGWLGS
jgi:hypothetical protein